MIDIHKNILITWANWFVWANLVHRLVVLGCKNIHIILRTTSDVWRLESIMDKIHIHYVSLSDNEKLTHLVQKIKPNIVYHLAAAWAYIGRDWSGIQNLFETNVIGTINLLNACKLVWFDYFINTGSNSEYWEKDSPMNEDDILEPNNEYGVTKSSATLYCSYLWKKEQLPVYTFRLFAVYGYFEDKTRLIPSIMTSYIQWISPNLSRPTSVRDFIFIEDVIEYYLHIHSIQGDFWGVFNIWSWRQYTIWEVVDTIKKIAQSEKDPVYGMQPLRQKEPTLWVADMNKTQSVFTSVVPTAIHEWCSKTYQWFKDSIHYYIV